MTKLQLHSKTGALAQLSLVFFYQDVTPLITTNKIGAYNSLLWKTRDKHTKFKKQGQICSYTLKKGAMTQLPQIKNEYNFQEMDNWANKKYIIYKT